jgi:hypothetical protein
VSPTDFFGHSEIDTSDLDNNWYRVLPRLDCPPQSELHIEQVMRVDGNRCERICDPSGEVVDWEYDMVAQLFPDALKELIAYRPDQISRQ